MKSLIAGATLALAFVSLTHPSQAQDTGLVPVRAKIGAFFPQGSGQNIGGSTAFDLEADIAIPSLGAGRTFATIGYEQGSSNGGKLRVIPVTIGRFFSPPNPAKSLTGNVYLGAGLGPYFVRASNAVGGSESKVTVGGFGVVGYQFPNPYFIEAKYHVAGKVSGINPGGFALLIGRHF